MPASQLSCNFIIRLENTAGNLSVRSTPMQAAADNQWIIGHAFASKEVSSRHPRATVTGMEDPMVPAHLSQLIHLLSWEKETTEAAVASAEYRRRLPTFIFVIFPACEYYTA